jgi:hypothetical protein
MALSTISEQLIPMFGLTQLHHTADPETTLDKFLFLVENAITNSNRLTTIISFSALFALIAMRTVKDKFKGIWWIHNIPEVLLVVVASTSLFCFFLVALTDQSLTLFFSSFRTVQVGGPGPRYSWRS